MELRNLYPEIDGGKYPAKTETDRDFIVEVDAPGAAGVFLKTRAASATQWQKTPMFSLEACGLPGRWRGAVRFPASGAYVYTVEAHSGAARPKVLEYGRELEVVVEPVVGRYGAWYELFPRSQGRVQGKSGTFRDCEARLPDIKAMGFDVIYLAPIHPIGHTNRKGPNNSLHAEPGDPGCVWSIGDENGGHTAVHHELGTLADFKRFVDKAAKLGIRIALDVALTCSYDHPWIKEHPGWFFHNPDGTIKYAENPPKKYEDTVFLNFYPEDREAMWNELKAIFSFWIGQGVSIFRIDNPHTKPDEFWAWCIKAVKAEHPDAVFLSEAFTYYERLELLAKLGFSQSYTYFTWRVRRDEIIEYMARLTQTYVKDFLRPNFFANTPDILPRNLQEAGRPAFLQRAALAATLAPTYGIYSGFELCENRALVGGESYADSEKYVCKVWDWDRPGNIKDFISLLNKARAANPALHYLDNLVFASSTDEHVIAYAKVSPDRSNAVLVAVNLDPWAQRSSRVTVPIERMGLDHRYAAAELLTGRSYVWTGREINVFLSPEAPVQIYRLGPAPAAGAPQAFSSNDAETHFAPFADLQFKAAHNSDLLARREMKRIFNEHMAPRIFYGPNYDEAYHAVLDRLARGKGFDSILEMSIGTPGH
ncbi:MAG TPA: maltotransferase domain-containing protein [bacterium]|jgi:starch synthase (maltosyl-transferring)|nr:maltotransferase domain-containing protein [bacterium]